MYIRNILIFFLAVVPVMLLLCACSEEAITQTSGTDKYVENRPSWNFSDEVIYTPEPAYPQSASGIAYFQKGKKGYLGFKMTVPNGSTFWLDNGSLTPPDGTEPGANVTITMEVQRDPVTNELIYTFGPSGCTFDPPAEIYLDWNDLESENAKLFLLADNGSHVETYPDGIDMIGRTYFLRIPHFSRYAVAYSD